MTRLPLLLLLLFFRALPPTSTKRVQGICLPTERVKIQEFYYQPGDLIVGGNLLLATRVASNIPDFETYPFLLLVQTV